MIEFWVRSEDESCIGYESVCNTRERADEEYEDRLRRQPDKRHSLVEIERRVVRTNVQ